ncbi:MAG: thioredoxin-dependent thiol peroxidase [Chlamydiae bacterium]|nr:thioredoxin-dependent thiol peroxidase [Chlamydiota bacterium]MBI3278159.1 thioredoxin-dependent thiol peroxidase [Chlamydiota bacterium]
MIKVGDKAPDFKLFDQNKNEVSLKNFKGQWIVLYFYPKDSTPGCTREAIGFTQDLVDFKKLNAVILGVSPDSIESHCKFIENEKLKVTLLSDPEHKLLESYGAWGLKKNYGKEYFGVIRSTYLIDLKGNVAAFWPNVKVDGHIEEVKEKLMELEGEKVSSGK